MLFNLNLYTFIYPAENVTVGLLQQTKCEDDI